MISQETKTFYAFNIDKMFKAVFVGTDEVSKRLLLELLSECLDTKVDRIVGFIPIELGVRSKHERSKRLDLIVEVDGRKINVKGNKKELDRRFRYYEINVEKFAKLWYDRDMKIVREKPLLTMIGIKDPEELDKYSEKMAISSIKESVDKLKTLNSDKKFVYNITPEQDDILTKNTLKKIYKSEGLAEGKAEGKSEAQREMTINLLKNKYPIDEIIKITGLSKEEIKNIDLNNNHVI